MSLSKAVLNSVDSYKGIFLHVAPVQINKKILCYVFCIPKTLDKYWDAYKKCIKIVELYLF